MPRKYTLTLVAGSGRQGPRWRKIHRGRVYQWPAGKGKRDRDAYEHALKAWERKKRELDGIPEPEPPMPVGAMLAEMAQERADDFWNTEGKAALARVVTVEAKVTEFLADKRTLAAAGQLSQSRLYDLGIHLRYFEQWIVGGSDVQVITDDAMKRYYKHLLERIASRAWAPKTASSYLASAKQFASWATPKPPTNMKRLLIRRPAPIIKTYSVDDVKLLLAKASPRTRLYILLALGAGMTQVDIANLKRDEIDLKVGTITRKRSKTQHHEDVPTVVYRLWPATLGLLRAQTAKAGPLALLGTGGLPLLRTAVDAKGHLTKTDNVRSAFARLTRKTKVAGYFKMCRKTSSSLLADSQYADTVNLFLGHAAASMADRHYARAALKRLAEATAWLSEQYGV